MSRAPAQAHGEGSSQDLRGSRHAEQVRGRTTSDKAIMRNSNYSEDRFATSVAIYHLL